MCYFRQCHDGASVDVIFHFVSDLRDRGREKGGGGVRRYRAMETSRGELITSFSRTLNECGKRRDYNVNIVTQKNIEAAEEEGEIVGEGDSVKNREEKTLRRKGPY